MNVILAAADLLFDVDIYRRTVAALDAMTAERNALLQRVAVLEEQLQAMANDRKFFYDMATGNDAWRKAKRARANR